jgi:carbon storage regulator
MLVLSRKKNESLMIGEKIEVIVVEIRGDKVRLGIRYPVELPVHREEVYEAIGKTPAQNGPVNVEQWGPMSSGMLVLSRKKNESIVIADVIKVVVVEIRGDKVRLGIECPKELPPHRREVYDAIQRAASETAGNPSPGSAPQ